MKIKRVRKKPKAWLYPSAIEREYVKILTEIATKIELQAREFCQKWRGVEASQARNDGLEEELMALMQLIAPEVLKFVSEAEIAGKVKLFAQQTSDFNSKQFHRMLKDAYGVDIFTQEPWLDTQLRLFEEQNIALIKSIPEQLSEKLRYRFVEAVRRGERWEKVADEIENILSAPKKRAKLIARDQIGKLNGQLTKLRQENIGVRNYIWRTMLDERVRDSHQDREGKQFSWDDPPDDGHPQQAILCRCYAEAVLPDMLGEENIVPPVSTVTTPEIKPEHKALPNDLQSVIAIGRSIYNKYQDVIDDAMEKRVPHEGIMEIMRREGVELGGIINVVGVEKRAMSEIAEAVKRYPKSWVEKSNAQGKVFVRESKDRAYHSWINVDSHFLLLKRYPLLKKSELYKQAKIGDSFILAEKDGLLGSRLSTHIHEYGHRLQRVLPELDGYFAEFWKEHTRDDQIEYLADLLSEPRYRGEIAKKDHFPHPYYGKIYYNKGKESPREMLTMTFEALLGGDFDRFDELMSKNPDLFDLGLALLTRYK